MSRLVGVIVVLVLTSFVCGLSVKIKTAPATAAPAEIVEAAAGKPASASSYWWYGNKNYFPADGVVDGRTDELDNCVTGTSEGRSYWLLADHRTGWAQVDLLREYSIVKIRWLNTHNGPCQDRATTKYHVALSETGDFAGEELQVTDGTMELEIPPQFKEYTLPLPIKARYVRFYVDKYFMNGGGLNELEVYVQAQ